LVVLFLKEGDLKILVMDFVNVQTDDLVFASTDGDLDSTIAETAEYFHIWTGSFWRRFRPAKERVYS